MNSKAQRVSPRKGKSLHLATLIVVFVALIAYKLFLPWTPFWVDLIVISIGVALFLIYKAYGNTPENLDDQNEK